MVLQEQEKASNFLNVKQSSLFSYESSESMFSEGFFIYEERRNSSRRRELHKSVRMVGRGKIAQAGGIICASLNMTHPFMIIKKEM